MSRPSETCPECKSADGTEDFSPAATHLPPNCARRRPIDSSGSGFVYQHLPRWAPDGPLTGPAASWDRIGRRLIDELRLDQADADERHPSGVRVEHQLTKATLLLFDGDAEKADETLAALRDVVEGDDKTARRWLASIAYLQGITAMRRAENENCVHCASVSSCILPIAPEAVHLKKAGARTAVRRFTEILEQFPDDLEVRWLLNVASMTLGEWPDGVEPRFRLSLDKFLAPSSAMKPFEDVGERAGLSSRLEMAGGAVMEDFDGDGLLDVALSSSDLRQSLAVYRNRGDGTFEDRTAAAGVADQLGGLNLVQTDYDNDGRPDLFVVRGAWLLQAIRPSLLRNRGDGTFEDVTAKAGLAEPLNSNSASWADYDNDGFLDVFVCCERQPNKLYRNRGDGTFEDVAARVGVEGGDPMCKGAAWLDYDDDRRPDLFVNVFGGAPRLYHNEPDGTFRDVTREAGIDGPIHGFSCWAFDYDDDGRMDIFATCFERTAGDVVKGLIGEPHGLETCRLWRNVGGGKFEDAAKSAGLDGCYSTMGSNFADFDGDGRLDMYLSTGEPQLGSLVPNRMFRNVDGKRFEDVTAASRTGHLQKGHAVACGDWDRDGDVDLLVELGGAVPGDRYHPVLFENPGHGNAWLTVKLVGVKTNHAAIGARIKVVTEAEAPLTLHRVVSTGSSFGANPLEQTIGLGKARRVATLEVRWPTSGTTQVFHDVPVGRRIEITEFAESWRPAPASPVAPPR